MKQLTIDEQSRLAKPAGLTERGKLAYDLINTWLRKRGATDTGGYRAFYSPDEWRARGEAHGVEKSSVLVIEYDGSPLKSLFDEDDDREDLDTQLDAEGLMLERGTHWYSAVYDMRT